jgi:acyl carrier protein
MSNLEEFISNWIEIRFELIIEKTEDFFEAGILDSLSFAELVVVIEEVFHTEINFENIEDWQSVSSVQGLSDFVKMNTKFPG